MGKNNCLTKTIFFWLRQHYHDIVFFLLLLIGLFLRLSNLHYPVNNAEASRDYLIAHHIVAYHEYPLVGPWSGVMGPVKNSPLYYYVLAGFLLIKNDILFLGFVNIVLQLVSIFCIYLLAQKMFCKTTGLIAAGIFLFSHISFVQSSEIWQPYVMQPFINISFLLLYMSHQTKKTAYLLAALFVFIFAGAIHNSAFALLPSLYFFAFLIARLYARPIRTYCAILAVSCASVLVWWIPVVLSFMRTNTLNTLSNTAAHIFIPPQASAFISHSANAITSLSYIIHYGGISPYTIIGIALAMIYVLIRYRFRNDDATNPNIWVLLFGILQMITLASVVNAPLGWHHFTPLFGLSFIVIAEMIRWFSSRGVFSVIIGTIVTCSLLYAASNNFNFVHFKIMVYPSSYIFNRTYASFVTGTPPFYIVKNGDKHRLQEVERMRQAGDAILRHLYTIQNNSSSDAPAFFDIVSYKDVGPQKNFSFISSAPFWVLLEKEMHRKLIRTDDTAGNSFEPIGDRRHLFLICHYSTDTDDGCVEIFKKEHPDRTHITQIYRGESLFSVYHVY